MTRRKQYLRAVVALQYATAKASERVGVRVAVWVHRGDDSFSVVLSPDLWTYGKEILAPSPASVALAFLRNLTAGAVHV